MDGPTGWWREFDDKCSRVNTTPASDVAGRMLRTKKNLRHGRRALFYRERRTGTHTSSEVTVRRVSLDGARCWSRGTVTGRQLRRLRDLDLGYVSLRGPAPLVKNCDAIGTIFDITRMDGRDVMNTVSAEKVNRNESKTSVWCNIKNC